MTKVSFDLQQTKYKKLTVMGHSGYSDEGSDIVCAAISSSLNLAGAILEKSGTQFRMNVGKSTTVIIELSDTENPVGQYVFAALHSELSALSQSYPDNVKVTVAERFR